VGFDQLKLNEASISPALPLLAGLVVRQAASLTSTLYLVRSGKKTCQHTSLLLQHALLSKRAIVFVNSNRMGPYADMLVYRCPTTAKLVQSSIEVIEAEVRRFGGLKLSLWCPYCQAGHAILGKDTQVVSVPSAA
jgi:hypothetical protein